MHQTDRHSFLPVLCRSRIEQKLLLLNVLFPVFVFCFLWQNLCKEWVPVFVSFAITYCFTRHNDFFAKKISVIFTASCSLPQRLQRQRLLLLGWSNVKRVIFFLHHSCRPVLTVSGVTWLFRSWAKCGHSLAAKVVIKMGKKMRNG